MSAEIGDRGYTEGEVNFDVVVRGRGGAGDNMKLAMRSDSIPDVPAIVEGLGNSFESDDLIVEIRALL
jgi:hypothetical protein